MHQSVVNRGRLGMSAGKKVIEWLVRAFCVAFGLMLMSVSLYGMLNGILWAPRFNYRYGEQGVAFFGIDFLFGALLLCVGAFARDPDDAKRNQRHR